MENNETRWWGNCCNTYGEETKQMVYAKRMGLRFQDDHLNVHGKKILDIGGGPVSLLLKTRGLGKGKIIDPSGYPAWTYERYKCFGIDVEVGKAEGLADIDDWDEIWIYNVLQHVDDPELIIKNARRAGKLIRIFEWIDIPAHEGHPHELKQDLLEEWLGGIKGTVEDINESGCTGRCFYGVFRS
ncbi:class I SAM-dependent methyltransferase [bacterium]|nr:class I SAM-dependent methyltransferase [bacterium]